MAQLADRVQQVKRLKAEKARTSIFHKKEKVSYIEADERGQGYDIWYEEVEENNINMAELKPEPLYICKLLKPSDGKNHVEPKNEKFVTKTYTFNITKCGEIFDLVLADGQFIVPMD